VCPNGERLRSIPGGELVGLRVKRVDLLHGRVTVAEQVAEVNGQLLPGPPKTEAGRRKPARRHSS
jgi:hypothetical protein